MGPAQDEVRLYRCEWGESRTPLTPASSPQELHAAEVRRNKEQREEMSG